MKLVSPIVANIIILHLKHLLITEPVPVPPCSSLGWSWQGTCAVLGTFFFALTLDAVQSSTHTPLLSLLDEQREAAERNQRFNISSKNF